MASYTDLLNNFTAGELSPKLEGRLDLPFYRSGCRVLENFFVLKLGGVERRPGTFFVSGTKGGGKARLVSFQNKAGTNYILEFTNEAIRFFKDRAPVLNGGSPYEIVSPYSEAALSQLKFAVVDGELWMVHPSYRPHRLVYTSDTSWAISAVTFTGVTFDSSGNYPSAVAVYAGRVYLAATDNAPYTVWASKPPVASTGATRFTDFTLGSNADDAIVTVQSDMRGSRIRWLEPHRIILAGADRSEWAAATDLPTPASFNLRRHAAFGVEDVQAVSIDAGVVYVRKGGKRLGILSYSQEAGGMVAHDLTAMADHITGPGIVDLAVQTTPESMVWALRSDGMLVTLALDQANAVMAFSRHSMGGGGIVESVAVTRGTVEDEIWVSVNRGGSRTVEYFAPRDFGDQESAHFVDCGIEIDPGSETVTGLDHLNGMIVSALGDGAVLPDKVVESGSVTYSRHIGHIHIGLPYVSRMRPERIVIPLDSGGFGKKKKIEKIVLLFYETLGGKLGSSEADLELILYRDTNDWETALPLFSGEKEKSFPGKADTQADILIVQDQPYPMTILAVSPRTGILEA